MSRASLVLAMLAAFAGRAAADAKLEANKHVDKASELFAAEKYADALVELNSAYSLDPRPEILYAIGQAHSNLGHCDEARTYFERFIATKPRADMVDLAKQAIQACVAKPHAEPPPPPP